MKKKIFTFTVALIALFSFSDVVKADAGVYGQCTYTYDGYQIVVQELDGYKIHVGEAKKGKNSKKTYSYSFSEPKKFFHADNGVFYCPALKILFKGDKITLTMDTPNCGGANSNCDSFKDLKTAKSANYTHKCAYESSDGDKVIVTANGQDSIKYDVVSGKSKFKLGDGIFYENGAFTCPSGGLIIQTCTDKDGDVTKYWKLAKSNTVFCDDDETVGEKPIYEVEPDETTKSSKWNTQDGNTNAFLKKIWGMLRVIIPALIVILSTVDFLKVVFLSDEKVYKTAYTKFLKRVAIGIILFVIPSLIKLILDLAGLKDIGLYEVFK